VKGAKMLNKLWIVLMLLAAFLFISGCASRKTLTASSAREMLQEHINSQKAGDFLLDYSGVVVFTNQQTYENYKEGRYEVRDPKLTFQRLLNDGLVTQSAETLTFLNLTGSYEGPWPVGGDSHISITLSMTQGSSTVSGSFNVIYFGHRCCDGAVSGEVDTSGTANLNFKTTTIYLGGVSPTKAALSLRQSGNSSELQGMEVDRIPLNLHGKSAGGEIRVNRYTYTFSTKFAEAVAEPSQTIKAGKIQVDSIDQLLLGSETMAGGKVNWHVNFNEVARTLAGEPEKRGVGTVLFGKQPDGTWVVANYSLN
jgi:hypothetical protein